MQKPSPFRHQQYGGPPPEDIQFLTAEMGPQANSDKYRQGMQRTRTLLESSGVAAIYLIHGTFVGSDASGWIRRISRVVPRLGNRLRRWQKQALDSVLQDHSNYSQEFRSSLAEGLGSGGNEFPVRLFHWSSENHHIGRADGTVRLLHQLACDSSIAGKRVLLWAHSHGGNLLALLSQLLGMQVEERMRLFDAARGYYRNRSGRCDIPIWEEAQQLCQQEQPLETTIDAITFGAPVRYGWCKESFGRLLHVIFHRRQPGLPPDRAAFPFGREEFDSAAGGDYIQQLGIAGTDFSPGLFAWRSRRANRALKKLFEAELPRRDLYFDIMQGQRVHHAGPNLLVDYGEQEEPVLTHLAGHALYTMLEWLYFHATTVTEKLYGAG